MKNILTRSDVDSMKRRFVDVKALGGMVRIQEMSIAEIFEMGELVDKDGELNVKAQTCYALAHSLVNEDMVRLYSDKEADLLAAMPVSDMVVLQKAMSELNPLMSDESLEASEKNSESGHSSGPRTNSRKRSDKRR